MLPRLDPEKAKFLSGDKASHVVDLGDMIEEITEDKPTLAQEARKIAKEKAIITLVLVILFYCIQLAVVLSFHLESCNNIFHDSPQSESESQCT